MGEVMQVIGEKVLEVGLWKVWMACLGFTLLTIMKLKQNSNKILDRLSLVSTLALAIISAFFLVATYFT